MKLELFNTKNRKIEEFRSITPDRVLMYSCGPTVYNYPHIGNWASYIYWDVLVRLLKANGYEVQRVINITDVGHLVSDADTGEDKLEKGAKREGKTAWEIADYYTKDFIKEFDSLNLTRPDIFAKATDFIKQQLDLIKILKDKGYTYQISDGIYFDTSKFNHYADFAKLDLDGLRAGARVNFNAEKRNASDFALWKFTPAGQTRDMQWITPNEILEESKMPDKTIMGFPGWHLECSAIAMTKLGETIDIHTGGIDHIPVHHTNEIAQSECATGKEFSKYWLHNDFLKIDGKKVSKSLGNFYTLNDLNKKGYSALDFKLFVLQGHYQNEGNFTFEGLESAKNRLNNWKNIATLRYQLHDTLIKENNQTEVIPSFALSRKIIEILNTNLSTPEALKFIDETFKQIEGTNLSRINRKSLVELLETIDNLLGLNLMQIPDISENQKKLIIERKNARINKDWHKSDKIRDELLDQGIELKDSDSDTIWQYVNK